MKNNIIIGIVFLVCLFIFQTTVHADSGQLYNIDSATLELRDAPDQNATVLAELKNNEEVTIFEESYSWGKTFYNGREAWAALDQLSAVNGTQTEQVNTEQPDAEEQQVQTVTPSEIDTASSESAESGQLYQVRAPIVRLRDSADKNATIVTELNNGEEVTIFEESFGWGKTFYNDKEAWIALYLLDEKNKKNDPAENTEGTEKEALEAENVQKDAKELEARSDQRNNHKEESETKSDENDVENEKSAVETEVKEEKQDVHMKQGGKKTLSGYHFVIDPGHGGKDPGAIKSGVDEKTLTLSTAKKVERQLREKGATVTLTRTDDTFIPLEERAQISNATNADAFISLHYNVSEDQNVHGIHTFYYNGNENVKLANTMQKSLINHVRLNDLGAKHADFKVLRDNKQHALLIELGFISNPEELKLVQTNNYQEKAAKGIVAGLEEYFD